MNFSLKADEVKKLLEMAYLGEWVINSHHGQDFQDDAASNVAQRIMAAAKIKDVDQDPETGNYYMDSEWLDRIFNQYVVDYDDHVFWDELVMRLAERDLAQQRGIPSEQINREDDLAHLRPLEERYRHEIEEFGVEHLELRRF